MLFPIKIKTTRILKEHPDVDGAVLQGRFYYDAFVFGAKAKGVYVSASSSLVCATPTGTIATSALTLASSTTGAIIKYTVDGSDPRYSKTAEIYGSAIPVANVTSGVVNAYAYKANMLSSGVLIKATV